MEYASAGPHAAAPAPAPAADPHHPHHPHPYSYPYPYAAYHQPGPSAADHSAASSNYYYHNPAAPPPTAASAPYDPYAAYHYYTSQPALVSGGADSGLTGYYFSGGETSQAPAASGVQPVPGVPTAAAGKDEGKNFGFDPQLYAQVAAARASNGMAPPVAAPSMHHAQWNAHFGHPVPRNVLRKHIKKMPKVVQPAICEVCKIQCDTLDVLRSHKLGKKHKKNLEKLKDSITPKQVKPPSNDVGANVVPSVFPCNALPAVQTKKKKITSATPEDLEVKKRRVLEAGAAQGEVKICTVCNVVVNSQKVYDFHLAGQKHQAMVQKHQARLHIA